MKPTTWDDLPPVVRTPKAGASAYHTRKPELAEPRRARYEAKRGARSRTIPVRERRVIAWDGEGIKLSGDRKPQHYVLFGSSADIDNPLRIEHAKDDLDFYRIVDYVTAIGGRFPKAIHVGYFFKYDHNMIIKALPWPMKVGLYERNAAKIRRGAMTYSVRWIPGKSITLSKWNSVTGKLRTSVTIDDIGPFFASSFIKAYSAALRPSEDDPEWQTVVAGKAMRADTTYDDMGQIGVYWRAEMLCLERLAVWFRNLMVDAGFPLTKWYGPGALANLLRVRFGLNHHEHGGKVDNMPPAVHDASKRAYFGGHVEQFRAGRVLGPIYLYDLNSAYPAAFTNLPSLREGGEWRHVEGHPGRTPQTLSVWRVRYKDRRSGFVPVRPQPLPHRNERREITYPPMVHGWYWLPEVTSALYARTKTGADLEIVEGWEWWPADETERPWAFMADMYRRRAILKAEGSPLEMAYKLGLNSMYGKMAQRAGWDKETCTPPRAHTLPLAGYVTAWCRARIMQLTQDILTADPDGVVAVETDGVFSLLPPEAIGIETNKELGGWGVDIYDELMYVQNGVYLLRQGDKWVKVKARGMAPASVSPERMADYLRSLRPGETWEPMTLAQGEVFVGLGSAISRATTSKGEIAWPKASALHCRWQPQSKDIVPGLHGKRVHISQTTTGIWVCPQCEAGMSAYDGLHTLRARTNFRGDLSAPYQLPWEPDYTETEYDRLGEQTSWETTE